MTEQTSHTYLAERLNNIGWEQRYDSYASAFSYCSQQTTAQEPALSVVVIAWQPGPEAIHTLEKMVAQKHALAQQGLGLEIIFVDNGSTNNLGPRLRPLADCFVRLTANTGAYVARNIGSVFAHGPVLLFLEDDGVPQPDLATQHINAHTHYDILMARGVYRTITKSPLNRFAGHYYRGDKAFPRFCDLEGNASIRTSAFRHVGGWDENIFFGHGGVELSYRLVETYARPEQLIYTPGPVLFHDYAKSQAHLAAKRERQALSRQYVLTKHPDLDDLLRDYEETFIHLSIPLRTVAPTTPSIIKRDSCHDIQTKLSPGGPKAYI